MRVHGAGGTNALAEGWKYCLRHGDQKLELTEGKMTVGRSRHCDLSIQEPSISRKHVFLTVGGDVIQLQDLGSSNGTFINESQVIGESSLRHEDILRLGNARLTVEIRPDGGSGPEAPPTRSSANLAETADTAKIETLSADASAGTSPRLVMPGVTPAVTPVMPNALDLESLADDPDSQPTKRLDTSAIDWSLLQGERAGFWPRFGATAVDALWVVALAWVGHRFGNLLGALVAPVVLLVVTWLGWSYWGTTPGKRLFRLYVFTVDAEVPGRPGTGLVVAAIRLTSCFLSFLLFGLGFVAITFSPARLALHDRLSGTFVLRKNS